MKSKLHYFTFCLFLVIGTSLNAQQTKEAHPAEVPAEVDQNRSILSETSEIMLNGERYLKVHFQNTTNTKIEVVWSLVKAHEIVISEQKTSIPANSSVEFIDATMPVLLEGDDTKNNYTVLFN